MSVVEADKLVEQAHKGMKSFFSFGTSKFEAAAEKLVRAGNIFKANKYSLSCHVTGACQG